MRYSEKLAKWVEFSTLHCNNRGGPVAQRCYTYDCDIAIKHTAVLLPKDRIRMGEKAIYTHHLLHKIQDDTI